MQSLEFDSEPEHDKRFYLPTSQYSKSIPPWPGSHWLKETMSLIKTGRGPANMAHPSFSQQRAERKEGGGGERRETDVPQEPWHPMDQALFVLALA